MDETVRPHTYYLDAIREVDEITARKAAQTQTLPPDSIWNKYKLSTVHASKSVRPTSATPSLGRELKRIETAVACEMSRIGRGSLGRHMLHIQQPASLTPREREIEDRLLVPFRDDPVKRTALLAHVAYKHAVVRKAAKSAQQELATRLSVKLTPASAKVDRQTEAARRRTEMEEGQREALADLVQAQASRDSVKMTVSVREHPESRYLRGVAWLRVIAVAARVELMRSVLLSARLLRAQDITAWNAARRIQRAWRLCFFKSLLRETIFSSGESMKEEEFSTSLASMRLRRATRSEKTSSTDPANNRQTAPSGLSAEQTRRALFTQRTEAVGLITTFLRDMQRLFRNRLLKYVRLVKALQRRFRVHRAVGQARTHLLTAWCERHLPALLLHVRIVSAGRGLDLKNVTSNDRENIRLAQQQFHQDYRYAPPIPDPQAAPLHPVPQTINSDPPAGGSVEVSRRGSTRDGEPVAPFPLPLSVPGPARQHDRSAMAQYRRLDSSLLRAMFSAAFHAFLRAHLDLIESSDFVAYNAVASKGAFGTAVPGTQPGPQRQLAARQQALHAIALDLVFRKRREFVLRTTKHADVVHERFEVSLEAVQRFVRGGEDPLTLHLQEQRRRELVHSEMRLHRKLGSRRRTGRQGQSVISNSVPSMAQVSSPSPLRARAGTADLDEDTDSIQTSRSAGPAPTPPAGLGLARGVSFKGRPATESCSNGSSSVPPVDSPGTRRLPASPGNLSRGSSFKRSASKSGKGNPLTGAAAADGPQQDPHALALDLPLPLPEAFLLLRTVTAEEMALLYFNLSDQLRRATAARDGSKRRQTASTPTQAGRPQYSALYLEPEEQQEGADLADDRGSPAVSAVALGLRGTHTPGPTHGSHQPHLHHRKQSSAHLDRRQSVHLDHQPHAPTGRPPPTQHQQHKQYPAGPLSKRVHIA